MGLSPYPWLLVTGAVGYVILWREGVFRRNAALFLSAALLLSAMALRGLCMEHETLDYQNFLTKWVGFYRENGGFQALGQSVGNYNLPYLYFLALFSYSSMRDLYLIKLLSILFDVLLAWGALRIVRKVSASRAAGTAAFFIVLFLPTVVLNGAYWGQCDSIYGAFAVWSVAFALESKPVRAMIAIALSFAFKLQAVFLMPVFLIFLFARKIRWRHLPVFPLTYLIVVLPAVFAGRPLLDTVLLYFDQAGSVGSGLNYNSSSMYAFLPRDADTEGLSGIGIAAAFLFLALLFLFCFLRRKHLDVCSLLGCAVLISVAVPFLLPHMHDRYFFLADVLSAALAVAVPYLAGIPVCVSFASLLGYHAYLRMRYLLPMRYGSAALLAVLAVLIVWLAVRLSGKIPKKRLTNRDNLL